MKILNIKKWILLITIILYPYVDFYSPLISRVLNISSTQFLVLFLVPAVIGNIRGFTTYLLTKIPYYFSAIILSSIFFIWSIDVTRGLFYIISLSMAALFGFSIWKLNLSKLVWKYFSVTVLFFSILLYFNVLQKGVDIYFLGDRFGYIRGKDVSLDPNWLAAWLSIGLIYFFFRLVGDGVLKEGLGNTPIKKIIISIIILVNLYFIFITSSRSAVISLFIAGVVYLIINKKKKILSILLIIISMFLIIQVLFLEPDNDITVIDRITSFNLIEEERTELITSSYQALTDNKISFIFGYGTGSGDRAVGKYYRGAKLFDDGIYRYNNHNLYLDWVLQTGIFGFLYLVGLIYVIFKIFKSSIQENKHSFLFLLTFVIIQSNFYNPIKYSIWIVVCGLLLSILHLESNTEKNQRSVRYIENQKILNKWFSRIYRFLSFKKSTK